MHGDGLKGLGPTSRAWLSQVGIDDADALRRADAIDVFLRVKALQPGTSLNLLFALIGAQQGRDWRDIARERRTDLLLELDARRPPARRPKPPR
ncbi:TfoX/Sxy family DNA transformation protein [Ideonella sp. A 288]|uniref:TfoX/Sxy family DNA transformation protein n=1 Tax=Ideonella sp. A 288 TaxID=1962181 RepID=UPI00130360B8|nr:TfoX/Sxy family DNA transformation protein [Ideonella sp. A 288]